MPYCCFKDLVEVCLTSKQLKTNQLKPTHTSMYLEITEHNTPPVLVEARTFSIKTSIPTTHD